MSILYLNGWQVSARLDDQRISLSRLDTGENRQVALFNLDQVVCIGHPKVSMPLLHELMKCAIPVVFLTSKGHWLNTLNPPCGSNAVRRLRQYDCAHHPDFALAIAKALIDAKIHNMRRMLQRWAATRRLTSVPEQVETCRFLQDCRRKAGRTKSMDELRGYEGTASARYFELLDSFLRPDMPFVFRSRRPPRNPVNALLSWTYAILSSEIDTALRCAGLDPALGFLHEISLGRPSLVLDMLEPFRSPLCDALVLKLVNHRMLTPEHFEHHDDGGVYLKNDAKHIFFKEYELAMNRSFQQPKQCTPTTFRQCLHEQAGRLCKAIEQHRGFTPFFNA